MSSEENSPTTADLLQGFPKDALSTCILACGGLVEEKDTGVA